MSMNNKEKYSKWIKEKARELGFSYCGISKAVFLEEEAPRLENWLKRNMHGSMSYMENHFDKRLDPRLLVPGARCLAQATAGMIVWARRGQRSRMTIGVKLDGLDAKEAFGAHAWLETPHGIPVGGAEAAQFSPLMTIDPYA